MRYNIKRFEKRNKLYLKNIKKVIKIGKNKKYPNAIFTMDSTFYYWDLTDVIPDKFHLQQREII